MFCNLDLRKMTILQKIFAILCGALELLPNRLLYVHTLALLVFFAICFCFLRTIVYSEPLIARYLSRFPFAY